MRNDCSGIFLLTFSSSSSSSCMWLDSSVHCEMALPPARRRTAPEKRHGATGFLGKTMEPSRRAYIWVLTGAHEQGPKH